MVRWLRPAAVHSHAEKGVMNPPQFPEFKPVGLEDRDIIKGYLDAHPTGVCEMNFPNIFIWKDSERPRYTILNGNLCVLLEPTFEPAYFLPPAGGNEICEDGPDLPPPCPEAVARAGGVRPDLRRGFRVEEDRDNFDYVYLREDLAELKGKKFDGKRNRTRSSSHRSPTPMSGCGGNTRTTAAACSISGSKRRATATPT